MALTAVNQHHALRIAKRLNFSRTHGDEPGKVLDVLRVAHENRVQAVILHPLLQAFESI
jgi:hypothetical protein